MELAAAGPLGGKDPHHTLKPNPSRSEQVRNTLRSTHPQSHCSRPASHPAQPLPNAAAVQGQSMSSEVSSLQVKVWQANKF